MTELDRYMVVLQEEFKDVADLVKQNQEGSDGLERHVASAVRARMCMDEEEDAET